MTATTNTTSIARGPAKPRLGEELPVFCEKCGYSLHGLPSVRCDHCDLLYFTCPECGHRQPINTLRPAAQRIIGRIRAVWLAGVVFLKLNYFGWLLFAWFAMGVEWSYTYQWNRVQGASPTLLTRPLDLEAVLAFLFFAVPFGMVSRMLLLRWRRPYLVGLALAGLVCGAVGLGAWFRLAVSASRRFEVASAWSPDLLMLIAIAGLSVMVGAMVVWPIWCGLVRAFLPPPTAKALLDFQRGQSDRSSAALGRD